MLLDARLLFVSMRMLDRHITISLLVPLYAKDNKDFELGVLGARSPKTRKISFWRQKTKNKHKPSNINDLGNKSPEASPIQKPFIGIGASNKINHLANLG